MFRVPCAAFLLCHGCFFALGIWLFISANRELTAGEKIAVAVTCLSGAAEIYFFASFFLTSIPAISDQSPLVPIIIWAAAVFLIAVAANRSRRSADTTSPETAGYLRTDYLRTLGLITYPLYLTHNVIGAAMIHVLIDAGLDATLAVWVALSMLVLVCWFICAKIEPAVRHALTQAISYVGSLPRTPSFPNSSPAPGLLLPVRAKVKVTGPGVIRSRLR
jgi:peptidoglycan/LPS O-acetylase OafA/YrhL